MFSVDLMVLRLDSLRLSDFLSGGWMEVGISTGT